jgi:hypothetical protein
MEYSTKRLLAALVVATLMPITSPAQSSDMTVADFKQHLVKLEASLLPMLSAHGKAIQEVFRQAVQQERASAQHGVTCLPKKMTASHSMELIRHMKTVPVSKNLDLAITAVREWLGVRFQCNSPS